MSGARRHPARPLPWRTRRALLALCLWLAGPGSALSDSGDRSCVADWNSIGEVCLTHEAGSPRYGYDVLGDTPEWHVLSVMSPDPLHAVTQLRQPGHIFEDIAPRLADVTGDGFPEIVVVQSSFEQGARLAIFSAAGGALTLLATTPYIGERARWLAPVAIGDLNGASAVELAYIDRPHLAKRLRVWRYASGALRHVADRDGLTNHRSGWDSIAGGWRACSGDMILASGDWRRILAVRLDGDTLSARDMGSLGRDGLAPALYCPP